MLLSNRSLGGPYCENNNNIKYKKDKFLLVVDYTYTYYLNDK